MRITLSTRGMSLIDVIVGSALILIVFMALFGLLHASVLLSTLVKDQSTATTIATNQMEYIRSLGYSSVGTVGGIPSGTIPQNASTTQDGVTYGVRTFVEYVDDPADGIGSNDTNGITEDYKHIKITVSYTVSAKTRQFTLVSNYAPPGLETTVGGGTLQISVVDASNAPVAGASVHLTNTTISPSVDLTTFSNSAGIVSLPGAGTGTGYAVTVTKAGYSSAQTYARDATNQNPNPGYLTVANNQTTSSTFVISPLSQLTIRTYSPVSTGSFSDSFGDASKIATQSNTVTGSGDVILAGGSGSYAASGTATSVAISPGLLSAWGSLAATTTMPSGTTAVIRVTDASGALLPEAVLPGNAAGFTVFPVYLSSVSTSTYPSLKLSATLTSSDPSTTPTIASWALSYSTGPTPLPNVSFTLTGAKTIGTTGSGSALYKNILPNTTDNTGSVVLSVEGDSYTLSLPAYDVIDACSPPPYAISPGTITSQSLTLATSTTNALLVSVTDSTGLTVPGASVTLSRGGFTKTVTASTCGTAYFGGITAANDYSVTIAKTGYATNVSPNVVVSGHSIYAASF